MAVAMKSKVGMAPPLVAGEWPLGHLREFQSDVLGLLTRLSNDPAPVKRFRLGPREFYFVRDLDLIHEYLVRRADVIQRGGAVRSILKRTMGDGILVSDGAFWLRQRRMLQPAFHATQIANYADVMVKHALDLLTEVSDGQVHDVHRLLNRLTLGVVTESVFSKNEAAKADLIGTTIDALQVGAVAELQSLVRLPEWVSTPARQINARRSATLRQIIQEAVDERRASGESHSDLLDMLLAARDEDTGEAMNDTQIVDEVITIYLAGYDTTALTLTWTLYLLTQYPAVLATLQAEVDAVLGDRLPGLSDLPQLRYTEMVVKETLRHYPAAYFSSRMAYADVVLGDYLIPEGSTVMSSIYGTHHRADLWDAPFEYRPERFADNAEAHWHKAQFMPFSIGPHVCIGNRFAMMEAVLVLATLVRRGRFELAEPGFKLTPEPRITLSCGPLPMRVAPRD